MKLIYCTPLAFLQGNKKLTLLIVMQSVKAAKANCPESSLSRHGATLRSHFCFVVLFTLEKGSNKKYLCLFHDAMTKKFTTYIEHHHIASSATNNLPLDENLKETPDWMDSHRAMTHVSERVEISQVKGLLRSTSLYTCIVTQLIGWEAGWWHHCHVETLCPCRHTLPWVAEGTGENKLEHFSSKQFQGCIFRHSVLQP